MFINAAYAYVLVASCPTNLVCPPGSNIESLMNILSRQSQQSVALVGHARLGDGLTRWASGKAARRERRVLCDRPWRLAEGPLAFLRLKVGADGER